MKVERDLRDILLSKFTEKDIPVDDENWKSMRAMIDKTRARKKMRNMIIVSSAVLLVCGLGAYEIVSLTSKQDKPVSAIVMAHKSARSAGNINSANKENLLTLTHNTGVSSNNPVTQEKVITHSNSGTTVAKTNPIAKHAVPVTASITKVKKQHATIAYKTASAIKAKPVKQLAVVENNKPATKENIALTNATEAPVIANPIPVNTIAATNSTDENKNIQQQATPVVENVVANNQPLAVNKPVTDNNTAVVKNDAPTKKPDSATAKTAPQQTTGLGPIEGKPMKKNFFAIEGGAGASAGWKYNDTTEGRSINPFFGVAYTRVIDSSWSVKVGLQVSTIGGMGSDPIVLKHVTYDFGMNSNDTTITTKWIYYLTLPVQVEYNLTPKDAIGLGGSVSYLVMGSGSIEVSKVTGNMPVANSSSDQYLYVKGYNQFSTSVYALYKRTFCKNFSAYFIPYYGMSDVKNNNFFKENASTRDYGAKVLLSYTIL